MNRRRLTLLAAATLVVTAACSGPREPLEIGVNEVASDIVMGSQSDEPLATPMPPNALPLVREALLSPTPPPPALPEPTPTPAVKCPAADAFAVPEISATTDITRPPAAASYAYRNDGGFSVSGVNTVRGRFPAESRRTITNVATTDEGTFTFDVAATLADTVTTTSYEVIPTTVDDENAGIFVTAIVTKTGNDEPTTFTPTPALKFLALPVEAGTSWKAFGIDASSMKAIAFNATIENKERVDACGTIVDGVTVRINGTVAECISPPTPPGGDPICPGVDPGGLTFDPSTGSRETFTGRYVWGTQFGGVVLQDTIDILTDVPGASVQRTNTATIAEEPRA